MILRIFVWLLAAIFLAESIYFSLVANLTLGLILLYAVTALLLLWAVFYHPLALFCAHGVGLWLKWIAVAGVLCFLGLAVFIAFGPRFSPANGSEDALIVLGAGLKGERVSDTLRRRLDAAYDYHTAHPDTVIVVTGGQGPQEKCTEAAAMKKYLVAKGVPEKLILLEDRSTSTQENFVFAAQVLREAGYENVRRVAYVTNGFHCYRAGLFATKAGFEGRCVAASLSVSSVIPCYLREVAAVLYCWVFS